MRTAGYIAAFVGGAAACLLLVSLGVVDRIDGIPGTQQEPMLSLPTYLSFISVLLTAVTVVLTAVAIGIGLVAAITFKGLKDEARETSQNLSKEISATTAREVAQEALSEVKVKAMVLELYAKAENQRQEVKEWGPEEQENEER